MEKNEIIFFAIVIIAYLLCAFTLNVPLFVHYAFIALVLLALLAAILVKFREKFENKPINKILIILSAIFLVFYIICVLYETSYQKTLVIDSSIILIPFFGTLILTWFLKKSE